MNDSISRQAAIDAVKAYWKKVVDDIPKGVGFEELTQLCNMALEHNANILKAIDQLPSAQPEEAIPVAWLEEQAKWFESIDNAFAKIEASNIRVMIKKWRGEKDERSD